MRSTDPGYELKMRQDRLRRMARRQGLLLTKSRRRDQYATDYHTYSLHEGERVLLLNTDLDAVEEFLTADKSAREALTYKPPVHKPPADDDLPFLPF